MIEWLWLALLAAEPAAMNVVETGESRVDAVKIDILIKQPDQKCDAQTTDEIVVCADKADNETQRLRPIANANIYDKDESRADFGISENIRMSAEVDSAELGAGVVSKRIMARVKFKF